MEVIELIRQYLPCYLATACIIGFALMCYDKIAAKLFTRHRIPEKTLMIIGALGGATAMTAAMLLVRHKIRKPLFYIGLPLEAALHIVLIVLLYLL